MLATLDRPQVKGPFGINRIRDGLIEANAGYWAELAERTLGDAEGARQIGHEAYMSAVSYLGANARNPYVATELFRTRDSEVILARRMARQVAETLGIRYERPAADVAELTRAFRQGADAAEEEVNAFTAEGRK